MPYITKQNRDKYEYLLNLIPKDLSDGELNFLISSIIKKQLENGYNYQKLNSIIGVFECAKTEFYIRVITPYETEKIEINGKLY